MAAKLKDDNRKKKTPVVKRGVRGATSLDAELGQRLKVERLKRAISQQELGEKLGVSFQQVQKYEKGSNRISAVRILELASLFGVSVSSLFQGLERKVEADVASDVNTFITSARALRLLKAFSSIEDAAVQNLIVDLAERLASRPKS